MVHIHEVGSGELGMRGQTPAEAPHAPPVPPSHAIVLHTAGGEPHAGISVGPSPTTSANHRRGHAGGDQSKDPTFCVSLDAEHRAALSDAYIRDTLDAFPIKPDEVSDVRGPFLQLTRVPADGTALDVSVTHQFRARFGGGTPALRDAAGAGGLVVEELEGGGRAPSPAPAPPPAVRLSARSDDSFSRELDQLSTLSSSPLSRSSGDDPPPSPAAPASSAWEIDPAQVHVGHRIAVGGHGEVFVGKYQGTLVAVKLLLALDEAAKARFRREVTTLMSLRHPNLILFMGYTAAPHLAIVSEYMSRGSLFRILRRGGREGGAGRPLDPRLARGVAVGVARGMLYLHSLKPPLIHLDLKSPNILVDDKWRVKIADFGLSRSRFTSALTGTGAGTPEWMAPEVIRSEKHDEKADVFSYGVVLWECLTGQPPWDGLHPMQVVAAVGFMRKALPRPDDPEADPFLTDLAMRCMAADPAARPGFPEILEALETELPPRHVHSMHSTLSDAGSAAALDGERVEAAVAAVAAPRDAPAPSPFAAPDAAPPKAVAALGPEDSAELLAAVAAAAAAGPNAAGLSLDTPFAGLAPFGDDSSDREEGGMEGAGEASPPPLLPTPAQAPGERAGSAATTDRSFELQAAELPGAPSLRSTLEDVGKWGGRQAAAQSAAKAAAAAEPADPASDALLAASMASAQL